MSEERSVPPSDAARGGSGARYVQLIAGLVLFGASLALLVRSELGLDPWDVFHQGLSVATGLSIGACTIAAGVVVLLLWIPLRQRPGIGTGAYIGAGLGPGPRDGLMAAWRAGVGRSAPCARRSRCRCSSSDGLWEGPSI